MGLIPDEVIEEIRARVDLVALIGQHVQLKKAGNNFKGLCPFHGEKTPSFNVAGDRGFYYCFGCHAKGDAFRFVMEYEGRSFLDAARRLAETCGVTIPEPDISPGARRQRSERAAMLELNKLAAEFFSDCLRSEHGQRARSYLAERGLKDSSAAEFRLGFAPAEWHALADHLTKARTNLELAIKVGLIARQPRAGGFYDRFRDRLVCPVIVPGGEIAGFSARRLTETDEAGAKYINSPESPIYKKSQLLFGLPHAREGFRQRGRAVLVEGNFDVISLHQHGFTETVAPLGTALTDAQVDLLRRLADEVILLYDGDAAGRAAALRALQTLVAADVPTRIALLPAGEDPDTLVRHSPDALAQLLERAQPGIEYFINEVWRQQARSADGRAQALAEAAPLVGKVANPTKRDLIIGTLAAAMGVEVGVVVRAMRRQSATSPRARGTQPPHAPHDRTQQPHPHAPSSADASPAQATTPPPRDELALLAILADHPDLMQTAEEHDVFSLLTDARLRDMYSAARQGRPLLSAAPDDVSPYVAKHVLDGSYASVIDPAHCLLEAARNLRETRQKLQLAELQRKAVDAKRRGDVVLERQLVREILTTRRQVD